MKNNKSKKIIIFLFFLIITLVGASSVYAQTTIPLTVSPARQEINVEPGQSYNTSVKFANRSESSLTGNIKVADFIVTQKDGSPILLDNNVDRLSFPYSNRFSASSWVNLPFATTTISANDSVRISFKINVPQNATAGGHYIAVYFETNSIDSNGDTPSQNSMVSSSIVSLVSLRVSGEIKEEALITNLDIPSFIEFGPVNIDFDIVNKGDSHISPSGQMTLTNWFGKLADQKTIQLKNIFPDARRSYQEKMGKKWMFGRYKIDIVAAYGENGKAVQASDHIWVVPLTLIVIIFFGIITLTMAIAYIYKVNKQDHETRRTEEERKRTEGDRLRERFKDRFFKR